VIHDIVVIDASVWVSAIMNTDSNHAASQLWVDTFTDAGGEIVAPALLKVEVAAAVTRRTGQPSIAKQSAVNLDNLNFITLTPMEDEVIEASMNLAADLSLRAGDAIYIAIAHKRGLPIVSWDNQQLQRAASLVTAYTPDSFPF
jgi:predicted nucleic acid-binding protein